MIFKSSFIILGKLSLTDLFHNEFFSFQLLLFVFLNNKCHINFYNHQFTVIFQILSYY